MRDLVAITLIFSTSLVSAAVNAERERFIIKNVEIVERSDPEIESGVAKAWSKLVARDRGGTLFEFYAVYFGESVPLPKIGQVCDLHGTWGRVNEWIATQREPIDRARVLEAHSCRER